MKLAIMQPYVFPYIGYFQLISVVDKFAFYDDVNFIKQGWINRNRVLLNGTDLVFTIPLKNASSFKKIEETNIDYNAYDNWKSKFYKTLVVAYKKAPFFENVFALISTVFDERYDSIAGLAKNSIICTSGYLELATEFVFTSKIYNNSNLSGTNRVMDICFQEKAEVYINLVGGQAIYSKKDFSDKGVVLKFIQTQNPTYAQAGSHFVPGLSIIDIMMFNSVPEIRNQLLSHSLL